MTMTMPVQGRRWALAAAVVAGWCCTSGTAFGGIRPVTNDKLTSETATFFVSTFWDTEATLPRKERAALEKDQRRDWQSRYGPPSRRANIGEGVLLVSKDLKGTIVGCCSVETAPYSRVSGDGKAKGGGGAFNPRSKGSGSSSGASLARERVLSDDVPLMANLAVAPSARRKGVGADLARSCERYARDWGFDEIVLLVEESNTGARRLYEKLGYETLWAQKSAPKIEVRGTRIVNTKTTNVAMAKQIDTSPLAKLLSLFGVNL